MKQGAEKARASATATMEIVRKAMGLNYYWFFLLLTPT
jgi:hypothetical protein